MINSILNMFGCLLFVAPFRWCKMKIKELIFRNKTSLRNVGKPSNSMLDVFWFTIIVFKEGSMSLGSGPRVARLGVSPCFRSWLEGFNLFSRWFEVVGSILGAAVRVILSLKVGNWWRLTNFFRKEWTFRVNVPQMFFTPSVRVRKRRKRLTTRKSLLTGFVKLFSRVWKSRMSSRNWKGRRVW